MHILCKQKVPFSNDVLATDNVSIDRILVIIVFIFRAIAEAMDSWEMVLTLVSFIYTFSTYFTFLTHFNLH